MTREEHLLTILIEECAEVQQNATKALRFGLDDHHPETGVTNKDAIRYEFSQLIGVYDMLVNDGLLEPEDNMVALEKRRKVEKWLKYSEEKGKFN